MSNNMSRILFVDDEVEVLNGIKRSFRGQFDIETSSSPSQALRMIEESEPFAVIASDLRMEGMDGLELLSKASSFSPDSVFIMLTGFADVNIAVDAVNDGRIFRFLTKPCPPEQLKQTLLEAIEQHKNQMDVSSYTYTSYIEDGRIIQTRRSKGCLAVTGYSAQNFVKDCSLWLSMVLPGYRSLVKKENRRAIEDGRAKPIEFKIHKPNGTTRWIRDTIIPHCDKDGAVCRLDGFVEDITDRKEILQDLQYSRLRYQKMVDNVPGIVYQFGLQPDGAIEFLFISDRCRELLGIEPERIMRDSSVLISRMDSADRSEFYHQTAVSTEKFATHHWYGRITIGDKTKWFQSIASPERLEDGTVVWDGLMLDVTHNKEIEDEVRDLAKFPGQNPNPVMRVSNDGTIIYANHASENLLDLWHRKVGQRIPSEVYEIVHNVIDTGLHDNTEVSCGDAIFNIVFAPINEHNYVNLYARDITEVKNAQLKLIKANQVLTEHDRLKSEFVSTVSHELRTPLFIFKNIISNAMAGVMGNISPKLFENLQVADKSVERLTRIVSDFLDISKIESGAMDLNISEFTVSLFIEEIAASLLPLAEAKEITIETHVADDKLLIHADRDKITQVLTNLIGNAIKFIPSGGNINIKATGAVDGDITISVCDNGPGLSVAESRKIFNRFVQGEILTGPGHHGTGLGLTIAKELVELHGGKIWLETSLGNGCSFHFTMPVSASRPQSREDTELVAG